MTARGGSFGASGMPPRNIGSASAQQHQREPTKEEKLALQETIDENKRKGFFKRIFPSIDYPYYRQFFEEDRPLNRFIDEKLISKKRDNTHQARMLHTKMPLFLQACTYNQSNMTRAGAGPPSGIAKSVRSSHTNEEVAQSIAAQKAALAISQSNEKPDTADDQQ